MIEIGGMLRAMRKNSGLTMERVAVKIGVSQGAVSRWESGRAVIPLPKFIEYCEVVGGDALHVVAFLRSQMQLEKERQWRNKQSARLVPRQTGSR